MNRETFTQIAKDVLGQYALPAKVDELFDRIRDAGRDGERELKCHSLADIEGS